MKITQFLLVWLLIATGVYGQTDKKPACKIQELAIAAALGDADAQYDLAVEFHKGEAFPQDLAKAAALWKLAAKGGVISAYNNLGHLTYYGRGIKQNFPEGIRLWRIAATNGHPESQVHLGYVYSHGRYLRPNFIEAYAWAATGKYSAERDDDIEMGKSILAMANDVLDSVTPKLSPSERIRAEKLTKLYIVRHGKK